MPAFPYEGYESYLRDVPLQVPVKDNGQRELNWGCLWRIGTRFSTPSCAQPPGGVGRHWFYPDRRHCFFCCSFWFSVRLGAWPKRQIPKSLSQSSAAVSEHSVSLRADTI